MHIMTAITLKLWNIIHGAQRNRSSFIPSPKAHPFVCSFVKCDVDVRAHCSTVLCSFHTMYQTPTIHVQRWKNESLLVLLLEVLKSLKFQMLFIYIWQMVLVFTVTWFKVCAQVHSCGSSAQRFSWKTDLTLKTNLLHVFCRHGKCQHMIHQLLLEVYGYCVISR